MNKPKGRPLNQVKVGEKVKIVALDGGRIFRNRITSMGLKVGHEIKVVRGVKGGPMLVASGDTRLAIGHGMAAKIFVV